MTPLRKRHPNAIGPHRAVDFHLLKNFPHIKDSERRKHTSGLDGVKLDLQGLIPIKRKLINKFAPKVFLHGHRLFLGGGVLKHSPPPAGRPLLLRLQLPILLPVFLVGCQLICSVARLVWPAF